MATLDEFTDFIKNAPLGFEEGEDIKKLVLPNGEAVSCVRWNNKFYISGTDVIRCVTFRFEALGRSVRNVKKFEEGVFSDLRNLKPGLDASLQDPHSELLRFLHRHQCIRTQKKQKVFFWNSVPHNRMFAEAIEREIKRDALGQECTTFAQDMPLSDPLSSSQSASQDNSMFRQQPASIGFAQPLLNFQCQDFNQNFSFDQSFVQDSCLNFPQDFNSSFNKDFNPGFSQSFNPDFNQSFPGFQTTDATDYGIKLWNSPDFDANLFMYDENSGTNSSFFSQAEDAADYILPLGLQSTEPASLFNSLPNDSYHPWAKMHHCTYPSCTKKFKRREHLRRHILSHTGNRPFLCPVPSCKRPFSRKDNLSQHIKTHRF